MSNRTRLRSRLHGSSILCCPVAAIAMISAVPTHAQSATASPQVSVQQQPVSPPLGTAGDSEPAGAGETAQSSVPSAGHPADAGDIVVTAQRRSESLQRVPLAVTAITPERIEQLNLRDLPSLQQVTPGLQFNTGIDFAQVFIRGVGFPNTNPGVETAVATYIDGAYVEHGVGSAFDVLDPKTLQVLKGPQGTLWGRNATGGAILIDTADPTLTGASGRLTGEIGDEGHYLGEGVLNLPVSDTLAIRVAGRYREDGGYVRNLADGRELGGFSNWVLRAKVLFEPVSDFRAVAEVQLDRSRMPQGLNAEFLPTAFCLTCSASKFALPVTDPFTTVNNSLTDEGSDRSDFYNLRMSYDAGPISLSSVTAYRNQNGSNYGDFDFTDVSNFNIGSRNGAKTFTQDLTASSNFPGWLNGTVGFSYLHDRSYVFLDIYSTNTDPDPGTLSNVVYTESVSGFAEATAQLATGLKLTAGGRYTSDKRQSQGQRVSFDRFTPRVVLAYGTGPVNAYLSFSEGYKAGGFSTPSGYPLTVYQPETIRNYEAGLKFLSADRRVRANLAVFHYDHDNLQVLAVDQGNINNIQQTQNAAAKAEGVEFEGDFRPVDPIQLFGGASYLRARFTQFSNALVQIPTYGPGGIPTGLATGPEDLTGFRVPHAPRWTAFLGATANARLAGWKFEATGLVRYTSSFDFYPGGGGPLRADAQPGYATARLNADVTPPNSPFKFGVFINNLTNATYYDFRYTTAPFGGMQDVARPRTFGFRAQMKFGS